MLGVILLAGAWAFSAGAGTPPAPDPLWARLARRLTGETDGIRRMAIAGLRGIPGLPGTLRASLDGPNGYLALDAITALGMREMIPVLIRRLRSDSTGFTVHALNALVPPGDRAGLVREYRDRLGAGPEPALPTRVAILDSLARVSEDLPTALVRHELHAASPEVRASALEYARGRMERGRAGDWSELVRQTLADPAPQLRIEAQYALRGSATKPADLADSERALARVAGAEARAPGMPAWTEARWRPEARCRATYDRFFARPTIDVRVVYGYKDARPARFVADRYERLVLIERLTRACRLGEHACGFERAPDDSELLTKRIPGPDSRARTVLLRVVDASATSDDERNRRDPFQAWKSRRAKRVFLDGLSRADAVFYDGHSRDGGGPDFEPPRLTARKSVDFEWYRAHQPGFESVLRALETGKGPRLKFFGVFSCASTRHFLARARLARPDLAFATSPQLLYFSDASEALVSTLDSLLGMRCEQSFLASFGKSQSGTIAISGLFGS